MTSKLPFGKEAAAQAAEESRGVRSMTLTRDAPRLASVAVGDKPSPTCRRGPPSITKRKISFDIASRPAVGRNPFSVRPPVAEAFRPADDSRGRREDDDSTSQQAIIVELSQ